MIAINPSVKFFDARRVGSPSRPGVLLNGFQSLDAQFARSLIRAAIDVAVAACGPSFAFLSIVPMYPHGGRSASTSVLRRIRRLDERASALRGILAVAGAVLAGCSGAPVRPHIKVPIAFLSSPTTVSPGPSPEAAWWHAFGDPTLDTLIDATAASNLDVRAAAARVSQASADVDVELLAARLAKSSTQTDQLQDSIQVYCALGGRWQVFEPNPVSPSSTTVATVRHTTDIKLITPLGINHE